MIIICTTGKAGAGKTTFCNAAARAHMLPIISTGDILRDAVQIQGLPLTAHSLRVVSDELRATMNGEWMRVAEPALRHHAAGRAVLVDSIREKADLSVLRRHGGTVVVIGIEAEDRRRHERIRARDRRGDPRDDHERSRLDAVQAGLGLEAIMEMATVSYANNGTLADLEAAAIGCVAQILCG